MTYLNLLFCKLFGTEGIIESAGSILPINSFPRGTRYLFSLEDDFEEMLKEA